jgi:hypothetical protein
MKPFALFLVIAAGLAGCGEDSSTAPPTTAPSDRAGGTAMSATMPAPKVEVDAGARATSGLLEPTTTAPTR